jgi:hypothetical protein
MDGLQVVMIRKGITGPALLGRISNHTGTWGTLVTRSGGTLTGPRPIRRRYSPSGDQEPSLPIGPPPKTMEGQSTSGAGFASADPGVLYRERLTRPIALYLRKCVLWGLSPAWRRRHFLTGVRSVHVLPR